MDRAWLTPDRLTLVSLLVFTLLIRGTVFWTMRANLQQDPDAYREIAENLLRHGEFALGKGEPEGGRNPFHPTAYRPPLYPVILSNLPTADGQQLSLPKVAALHLLLGVATVSLTWLASRRLLDCRVGPATEGRAGPLQGHRIGGPALATASLSHPTFAPLMAGFFVACDPLLLNQQTLVMTETLAAFLAILSLWSLARFDATRSWFDAALAGGAIGLAVLCRPTFLPWLGLVGLVMLLVRGGPNHKSQISDFRFANVGWRAANLMGLVVAAAGVMSPWAIRNYRVFGKPIVTTTHGGYTLLLANNEPFYEWLQTKSGGLPWVPGDDFSQLYRRTVFMGITGGSNEEFQDRLCYEQAFRTIQSSPSLFFWSNLYRVGQLWSPLPHKLKPEESARWRLLRYATCAWYCGVYVLVAVGIWCLRSKLLQPPWGWGLLLCLTFTTVHTFYFTNMRMRAPLMPFVAIVAGAAAARTTERKRDGKTERK